MRIGHVIPTEDRGSFSRWGWSIVLAAVTVGALVFGLLAVSNPQVVVYPTTDFAHLPISATTPAAPSAPAPCVSIQHVNGSPTLTDEKCGSPASTFRVLGRVGNVAQCVPDADLTYSSPAGAVCLDYDWAANQCLTITSAAVSKVDCTKHGAVQPETAIIGSLDVTYCREGGIAHSVRHFTVCTLAGDKDCNGKKRGV
jgi:hypothetical protein